MPKIDLGTYGDLLFDAGIPGMDVDINISSIVSYTNGTTPLDVGVAVGHDANLNLTLPVAGKPVVGVTVRHPVWPADSTGSWLYPANAAVPVMEFGRVWVNCVDGCAGGEPVMADATGALSVSAGTIPVAGAFWDSKAAAGGIAIVRLNRLNISGGA